MPLMNRHMRLGGLCLPNLKAYHMAVTLDQIRYWWHKSLDKKWVMIKTGLANNTDWKALLLDPVESSPYTQNFTLTLATSLKFWKPLLRRPPHQSGSSQLYIYTSTLLISTFLGGVTTLDELYAGCHFRSFLDLQNMYGLPSSQSFEYLQLKHLFNNLTSKQRSIPTQVASLLQTPQYQKTKDSRVFYNLLTGNNMFSKSTNILKWEKELRSQFTISQ